jgi:hypothetical protein
MTLSHKPIGEMNGPWALLLKTILVGLPILFPFIIGWGIWVTRSINEQATQNAVICEVVKQQGANSAILARHELNLSDLKTSTAVASKVVEQIALNTVTLARHDKEIIAEQVARESLAREMMPMDRRMEMWVTRQEYTSRQKTLDDALLRLEQLGRDTNQKIDALFQARFGNMLPADAKKNSPQ